MLLYLLLMNLMEKASLLQAYDLAPASLQLQERLAGQLMRGHVMPVCLACQSLNVKREPHRQLAMAQIDLKVFSGYCCLH